MYEKNGKPLEKVLKEMIEVLFIRPKQRPYKTNNYIPHPADLSAIELPQELLDLAQAISKNVHEVWSAGRMSEGWTFGPVRNDEKPATSR